MFGERSIIKIVPTKKVFSITWNTSIRCNYDCMYCSPKWHDNTSKHKSLSELKKIWIDIFSKSNYLGLKYKISFTGGEVTGNKALYPFLKWLRESYRDQIDQILITSNGSASYNYYLKLFEVVDNISLSTHSEHIIENKFFDTVVRLHKSIDKNKFIHVNIMNEFWNNERITKYKKILDDNAISYSVNEIDYSFKTRDVPIFKSKLNLDD